MLGLKVDESGNQKDASGNSIIKGKLALKINEYFIRLAAYGFAGTILVAKDQEIILNKGYGLSKQGIRCTAETVFDIGSITKQFTATAIMKLEGEGRLAVNDSISKYFNAIPKDKVSITIHHLLTHTAGFLHSYGEDYEVARRDETLRKMFDEPLKSEPGKKFSYSNGGYSLLAALIEKITRVPYEEYLHKSFFGPLGMRHTGYTIPEWKKSQIVKDKSRGVGPYWYVYGNGGLLSNTDDLFKWHIALQENVVIPESQRRKLFTPYVETHEGTSFYGYGWFIDKTTRGTTLISHSGESGEGINSDFLYFTDENIIIIIFSDVYVDCMTAVDVARNVIEKFIFRGHYTMPPEFVEIDPSILQMYIGTYRLSSGAKLAVSIENDYLVFTPQNKEAIQLLTSNEKTSSQQIKSSKYIFRPKSEKKMVSFNFCYLETRHVTFNAVGTGHVDGFTIHKENGDLFAQKIR